MAWSTRLLRPFVVVGSRAAAAGPRCFSRRLPPVSLLAREQSSGGAAPLRKVVRAATADGEDVKVEFADGATYIYHALWLRDACRDEELVKTAAGERILHKTPLETLPPIAPAALVISGTHCTEGGGVHMEWSDGTAGEFQGDMLRAYAPSVALCATDAPLDEAGDVDVGWLAPYTGVPGAPAPSLEDIRLCYGPGASTPSPAYAELPFEHVMTEEGNLEMFEVVMRDGAVKIVGAPDPGEPRLHELADFCFNGLQKDPSRDESNWKIVKQLTAASVSYDPDRRLNSHSDQSLPNHGTPALFLLMHYAQGYGQNTVVDGIAVAEALRERDPEAFRMLSTYGNNQERDLLASRQDAAQGHTQSLYLAQAQPIIQLDKDGGVARIQYNEVFRTPSTVPYSDFKAWYAAYLQFANMTKDPEFERTLEMNTGDFALFANWRTMHGRAGSTDGSKSGLQSDDRTLVGGTVTQQNFYSRVRGLLQRKHGLKLHGPMLLS